MNRWAALVFLACGPAVLWRVETHADDSLPVRMALGAFLIGGFVGMGAMRGKDRPSTPVQVTVGVAVALAIAALAHAPGEGYVAAALIGVLADFTSDYLARALGWML